MKTFQQFQQEAYSQPERMDHSQKVIKMKTKPPMPIVTSNDGKVRNMPIDRRGHVPPKNFMGKPTKYSKLDV